MHKNTTKVILVLLGLIAILAFRDETKDPWRA